SYGDLHLRNDSTQSKGETAPVRSPAADERSGTEERSEDRGAGAASDHGWERLGDARGEHSVDERAEIGARKRALRRPIGCCAWWEGHIQFRARTVGRIPKWPTGADCKSAGLRLHWFKSSSYHHSKTPRKMARGRAAPRVLWRANNPSQKCASLVS